MSFYKRQERKGDFKMNNQKNTKKGNIKNSNSGITLIALVVTIIVLLILAGISIAMLSGNNGILTRTTDAKTKTERQSVIEQARIDVLGYQAENKNGDLDKTQLKAVLDTYFKDVPDLADLSETEIKETQLETLTKYGTHTIAVFEIYNGNIKSNNLQTIISFSIKVVDNSRDKGTFNFNCVNGSNWAQWAESTSEPFYTNDTVRWLGTYEGSLQDLILSKPNPNSDIYYSDGSCMTTLIREWDGGWSYVTVGDAIIEGTTYVLDIYAD